MTFELPNGEAYCFMVTRRQWLSLILRLEKPDELPARPAIEALSPTVSDEKAVNPLSHAVDALETPVSDNKHSSFAKPEADVGLEVNAPCILLKGIGMVKTDTGLSIRFFNPVSDESNDSQEALILSLAQHEITIFLKQLKNHALKAGWDIEAGLLRLRSYQETQHAIAKAKQAFH